MAEVVIRPLGLDGGEAWVALRHALWPEQAVGGLRDELADLLDGPFAGFGAFSAERLIGFAEVSERPYGDGCDSSPVAWLEAIYVAAPYRRAGVGRRLIAAVEGWARSRGLTELGSDAELTNLVSRLGHARWGFEETERLVVFRKVLQ